MVPFRTWLCLCVIWAAVRVGGQRPKDNFKCENCILNEDGTPKTLRLMYLESDGEVMNEMARARAAELGVEYSCDDPDLALSECFVGSHWDTGWVGETVDKVIRNLGPGVTAMTRANFSQGNPYAGGSSYTRCAWEVYLGNVDMCVGNFWETEERRAISSFTSSMEVDLMMLLTRPASVGFDSDNILGIFRPFHDDVWGVTLAMFCIGGVMMWAVERHRSQNSDFDSDSDAGDRMGVGEGLSKSIWLSFMGYVNAGVVHSSTGWAGRFVLLGYGFFVYITVASYTANLASFMIQKSTSAGIVSSISQITNENLQVCLLEAGVGFAPGVRKREYDDYIPMLEGLKEGRCVGAIIGRESMHKMVRSGDGQSTVCVEEGSKGNSACEEEGGRTRLVQVSGCVCASAPGRDPADCPGDCPDHHKYCDLVTVDDPEFTVMINIALPVADEVQNKVSAWITSLKLSGEIDRLRERYIYEASPAVCGAKLHEDDGSLSLESMVGTYLISCGFMLLGGGLRLWEWYFRTHVQPAQHSADPEDDIEKALAAHGYDKGVFKAGADGPGGATRTASAGSEEGREQGRAAARKHKGSYGGGGGGGGGSLGMFMGRDQQRNRERHEDPGLSHKVDLVVAMLEQLPL